MEQRLDMISLGVPDLEAARRFYVDGLGWEPTLDVPGDVVFIRVGHSRLIALWDAGNMGADVGVDVSAGTPRVTLAQNVGSPDEVDAVIAAAEAAGATVIKPGQPAVWGGYQGYFSDPAGFIWEVAHNPNLTYAADGTVRFEG